MKARRIIIAAALAATATAASAGLILSEMTAPPVWFIDLMLMVDPGFIGPIRAM